MKPMYVVAALLLAAQAAHAATFNPFRGAVDSESAVQTRKPPVPKASTQTPSLPALPPAASTAMPLPSLRAEHAELPKVPTEPPKPLDRVLWRVVGRMGDQITLSNQYGDKAVVSDGTMKSGCMVVYPDVLCERADIADAKKRIAAEARAREEEEATISTLKRKIAEMEDTIGKMRRQMNGAFEETAKFRASNAEMVEEKRHWGELPTLVKGLREQLETSTRENERLKAENVLLASRTESQQSKMEAEIAKVKASISAAPEWVKGSAKEFKDPALGEFVIRRQSGQVFFTIANQKETTADAMFGKNVIRKERRGAYTYYALNEKSVRFKE